MSHVCLITTHPFWMEPLGVGTLMRARYDALVTLADTVSVLFITPSDRRCPLPGGTLKVEGGLQSHHVTAIRNFVQSRGITLAYFSYDQMGAVAATLDCKTAVETHDALYLRQQQFATFGYRLPIAVTQQAEIASLKRYDYVLCLNPDEAAYFREHGVSQALYLPPTLPLSPVAATRASGRFGLIASQAVPNRDGLAQITDWLAACPDFVMAGPLAVSDLAACCHTEATNLGVLKDPREFYEWIDVALSPLRFGSGLKIKVLEALACGKPVLATAHAISGFPPGIEGVAVVNDDLSSWSMAAVDEARRIEPAAIADYVVEHFSPDHSRQVLASLL